MTRRSATEAGAAVASGEDTFRGVTGDVDATYASLVQQYLGLFLHDNAAFLAERWVAHSPKSAQAKYLLATCHYRNHSPKRAHSILQKMQDHNNSELQPSIRYLLAQCCVDLHSYSQAEDCLLGDSVRSAFRAKTGATPSASGSVTQNNADYQAKMDQWIISQTPCPIPNGAAGLYLLGTICRRTNRSKRAAEFYRLSLKLDPMLWTSYEALCEMGAATDITDDPTAVFGVFPSPLMQVLQNIEEPPPTDDNDDEGLMQNLHSMTPSLMLSHTMMRRGEDDTPLLDSHMQKHRMSSHHDKYVRPEEEDDHMFGAMRRGGGNSNTSMSSNVSQLPSKTLFAGARGPTPMGAGGGSSLHFATPNLTPIQRSHLGDTPQRTGGRGARGPTGVTRLTIPDGPSSVKAQAGKVVARLFYDPPLESTPVFQSNAMLPLNRHPGSHVARSQQSRLSFSSMSSYNTPAAGQPQDHNDTLTTVTPLGIRHAPTEKKPRSLFEQVMDTGSRHDVGAGKDSVAEEEEEKDNGGVQQVLELLCTLGAAQRLLCNYRCQEALQVFYKLPHDQFQTGWVQHQVGRAFFEMADYENAQRALETMQRLEPHRMKGLEVLSTTLWHLKKEVELSHLAQHAVDFDRLSAEAWCVVGNCFSLQKEHETALTFFRRSIQLDPSFTYSHTLSGHEYVSNEDFEKAVACFRDAIRVDERHYNAWYGLGAIYFRQEKYDLAEYHFRRALNINQQSSVLHCHLGMALHASGKDREALTVLDGVVMDPRNPQARYQRATIYMSLDRPNEALAELEKVRDAAPREASVHFAMGRVLKRLGRPEQAMRCFLTALDLDPKDNNLIKAAIDRLDEPDVDEDVSAF